MRAGSDPCLGKIPWRRERLPTAVFWPGQFHGLCSPWGRRGTTERLSLSWYLGRAGGGGCFQCPITWSCSALTPADRASAQLQATGQVSRACARAHLPRRKVSQALFDIYFPGFPLRFFGQSPVGPIWPHHPRELQRERTTVLDTVSPGPRAALLRGGFRGAEPSRGRSSSAAGLTASVAPGLL